MIQMETILNVIKEEALKRKCGVWELLDELNSDLENLNQKVEEKITSDEIIEEILKDMKGYNYFFIQKDAIHNIWYTESLESLEEVDENGYVFLKPICYYMVLDVPKEDLIEITREQAITLAKMITWKEGMEAIINKEYENKANEILEISKRNKQ